MGKKKSSRSAQRDPNLSLTEAANKVLKPYIHQQLQLLGRQLQEDQKQTLRTLFTRVATLESIIQKEFKITDTQLAELVADMEDSGSGLTKVTEGADTGDTLRITLSTKLKEQEEFQGESRLLIDDLGNEPLTIGPELEPALIGLKAGESKEVEFGDEGKLVAKLEVNRVSRRETPVKDLPAKEEPTTEAGA